MAQSENKNLIMILLFTLLLFLLQSASSSSSSSPLPSSSWMRAGYWLTNSVYPVADLDTSLFTHLYCAFAGINSSDHRISIPWSDEQYFASFSSSVKSKNPSIKTLLSIGDAHVYPTFMSMISNTSSRNSFIESSIKTATLYGFDGLDICILYRHPNTTTFDSNDMATFFHELRSSIDSHNRENEDNKLTLSLNVYYLPVSSFPVDSIQRSFDWVNLVALDYFMPLKDKFAHPHAALYDPHYPNITTDYGIREWMNRGLSRDKILMGLPFHGWVWTLVNPKDNRVGAPASGPGIMPDGSVGYKFIKGYAQSYKAKVIYDSAYVENYCSFGSYWAGFDDVEAIRAKVSYAREKGLRGYYAFQVGDDDNSILALAAVTMGLFNRTINSLQVIIYSSLQFVTTRYSFINELWIKRSKGSELRSKRNPLTNIKLPLMKIANPIKRIDKRTNSRTLMLLCTTLIIILTLAPIMGLDNGSTEVFPQIKS